MSEACMKETEAVFRKIFRGKKSGLKIRTNVEGDEHAYNEEVERKKREWKQQLAEQSHFLTLKSASEQKEEGIIRPLDTAWVEEKNGLPVLKAAFDVAEFQDEDIQLGLEGDHLVVTAKMTEGVVEQAFTKSLLRRLELPENVDAKLMTSEIHEGVLRVEMPFHLPPPPQPQGPNVFPIVTDPLTGLRKLCIMIYIGSDFTGDDVKVRTTERTLHIEAEYSEDVGKYGGLRTRRQFIRDYQLPSHIEADSASSRLASDGRLYIEVTLKEEPPFKVKIETEELNMDDDDVSNADSVSMSNGCATAANDSAVFDERADHQSNTHHQSHPSTSHENGT